MCDAEVLSTHELFQKLMDNPFKYQIHKKTTSTKYKSIAIASQHII